GDGVRVDHELLRERPDARQLIARLQGAGLDRVLHLLHELQIDRDARRRVRPDERRHRSIAAPAFPRSTENREGSAGRLMTVFVNGMTASTPGSPLVRWISFSRGIPSTVSYETNVTVTVRSPSLCPMPFGSDVCRSSVTRQSMPPSGRSTIVPSD